MRTLILIVAMLLPVWGWALPTDERLSIERKFRFSDSVGDVLLTCDSTYTHCLGPLIEQNACYQRMQEAMKAAHTYLPHPLPLIATENAVLHICDAVCRAKEQLQYEEEKAKFLAQWNTTLKDCVEGR